jgi:asparagine N-glycosylation enzyme membrane subunit Stt3
MLVTVISALGWGITRFRHAAEVSIVILAAVALSALYDRLRKRRSPTHIRPASGSAEPYARHARIRWPPL